MEKKRRRVPRDKTPGVRPRPQNQLGRTWHHQSTWIDPRSSAEKKHRPTERHTVHALENALCLTNTGHRALSARSLQRHTRSACWHAHTHGFPTHGSRAACPMPHTAAGACSPAALTDARGIAGRPPGARAASAVHASWQPKHRAPFGSCFDFSFFRAEPL
jgi:hypothetical protein